MISDNKIKCMYFNKRFNEKPQGKQCGWVQKSLIETEIAIEDLADALCHGASFKPGVLVGGMKADNWTQQQLFGLDFDNEMCIEEAYNKVDCQHFFRQIFLGYFSDIVQAFDTLRKNVCGDDYTSLHNPIVLSSVLPAYGMFHSIQILFL